MKTPKPKKPKKVAVFYPTNGLNEKDINRRMLDKISPELDTIKHKFRTNLHGLKAMVEMDNPHRPSIDNSLRQDFGYGLLGISGKDIKLYSLNAFNLKKSLPYDQYRKVVTYDHFFGCLCYANIMLIDFINSGLNIDYMVNEWLEKHLYLWVVIRVTKGEHKIVTEKAEEFHDNKNPNYELEYNSKRNMEHYKEISDIGFLVKE
jgi:hypothetical protein